MSDCTPVLCRQCLDAGSAALLDALGGEEPRAGCRPTVRGLIAHAAALFEMTAGEIVGPGRRRRVVRVRHAVVWVARAATGKSWPEIGRYLGGRDHSTMIFAAVQTEERARRDREFAWAVERLWAAAECAPWGPDLSAPQAPATAVRPCGPDGAVGAEREAWLAPPARPGEYRSRHALPLTPEMIDPDNAGLATVRAGMWVGGAG